MRGRNTFGVQGQLCASDARDSPSETSLALLHLFLALLRQQRICLSPTSILFPWKSWLTANLMTASAIYQDRVHKVCEENEPTLHQQCTLLTNSSRPKMVLRNSNFYTRTEERNSPYNSQRRDPSSHKSRMQFRPGGDQANNPHQHHEQPQSGLRHLKFDRVPRLQVIREGKN